MISLDDNKWKTFDGGYRIPYDASIPLKRLKQASTINEINSIFSELWNELHHQGDVGLASYYSVPYLIQIAKEKELYNFNVFGLISTIEIQRHQNNPPLPKEIEKDYLKALHEDLPELIKMVLEMDWDINLSSSVLSALAVSKGHISMANVICKMDDEEMIDEFLDNL